MDNTQKFGVLVIGDEILTGKRTDEHLAHVIKILAANGMMVAWSRVFGDERAGLIRTLQQTQEDGIPVFCFGGIGATPDDQTRLAAAEAFGVRLTRHPAALAMIEDQFGEEAYPNRVLMAELPEGCLLIPNAHNQIPGFTLYDHHFFPGFPFMAWPMLEWVLHQYYPSSTAKQCEESIKVINVRESDLVQLMVQLSDQHPCVKLFSLPHMLQEEYIEIGFRGECIAVDQAISDLAFMLKKRNCHFETINSISTNAQACRH